MHLHVEEARVEGPFTLLIHFNSGEWRKVNLYESLKGPVFEALHNLEEFARAYVNNETGTVEWPNGADFAPEYLYGVGVELEDDEWSLLHQPA